MKKLPLGIRFLLGLISFILSLALVLTGICTVLLGDLSVAFRKDNLQTLITQVLFTNVTSRVPAGNGMNGRPGAARPSHRLDDIQIPEDLESLVGSEGEASSSALVEFIYNSVASQFEGEAELPPLEEVQEFVEESTLDDFLAEKSASLISDIITGENTTTITVEEIQEQLEQNAQLIEDTFNIPMDEEVISSITTVVEETEIVQQIQNEGVNSVVQDLVDSGALTVPGMAPSLDSPDGNKNQNTGSTPVNPMMETINTLRSVVSTTTLLIMIGICLVLIGLLLVTNLKRIWLGMIDSGISLTIVGALFSALTIVVWTGADALQAMLSDMGPAVKAIIFIVNITAPIHLGVLGLGIALIVSGCIVMHLLKKKRKAALAALEAPAVEEIPVVEEAVTEEVVAE